MGHGRPLFWLLLWLPALGCHNEQLRSTSLMEKMRAWNGPVGTDVVQVEVAILERPIADSYLATGVWEAADEQVLPLEKKAKLEEHGLRLGLIRGIKPAELQTLLTSERNKYDRQRCLRHAGRTIDLSVGPTLPVCQLDCPTEGENRSESFEQVECRLAIVPSITSDGQTKLLISPLLRHGETILQPRLAEDESGFLLRPEKPSRQFIQLECQVILGQDQYLLIGGRTDKAQSLGTQFFTRLDEIRPVQRLVVIRTHIPSLEGPRGTLGSSDTGDRSGAAPLAMQAALK